MGLHENSVLEKEKHMKGLKRKLEPWREIILSAESILLWEKPWYPGVILAFTTAILLIYWIFEPAFLTWLSVTLFKVALIDYFAPILAANFLSSNWTGQKEKKFEEICQTLSLIILRIQSLWASILESRTNRPLIYYTTLYISLILLAWIGHIVDNLLLLYLFVNFVLLAPGLRHKQLAQQAMKSLYNYATQKKKA